MMSKNNIVNNYASSLYNSLDAEERNNILGQLKAFNEILKQNRKLYEIFISPIVSVQKKQEILKLIKQEASLAAKLADFFTVVINNNKCNLIEDIVKRFTQINIESHNIVQVEVISPYEISKEIEQLIISYLSKKLKKEIEIIAKIDKSIIGGVQIRYDSNLIDFSVKGALSKMKNILITTTVSL